jgi:hypothetical protein
MSTIKSPYADDTIEVDGADIAAVIAESNGGAVAPAMFVLHQLRLAIEAENVDVDGIELDGVPITAEDIATAIEQVLSWFGDEHGDPILSAVSDSQFARLAAAATNG